MKSSLLSICVAVGMLTAILANGAKTAQAGAVVSFGIPVVAPPVAVVRPAPPPVYVALPATVVVRPAPVVVTGPPLGVYRFWRGPRGYFGPHRWYR